MNTTHSHSHLIEPHGGQLTNLILDREHAAEKKAESRDFPSWDLTPRQICDLEMLLNGGFSPLTGFMNQADYEGVCHDMHLKSGILWPMPITLDVSEAFAKNLTPGSTKIALRDAEGVMIAILHVEEVWQPDRSAEAKSVFASTSQAHPGVGSPDESQPPSIMLGVGSKGCSFRVIMTLRPCDRRPLSFAPSSRISAGDALWLFRRATQCIARTSS